MLSETSQSTSSGLLASEQATESLPSADIGAIAGGVVGGLLALLLLGVAAFFAIRLIRNRPKAATDDNTQLATTSSSPNMYGHGDFISARSDGGSLRTGVQLGSLRGQYGHANLSSPPLVSYGGEDTVPRSAPAPLANPRGAPPPPPTRPTNMYVVLPSTLPRNATAASAPVQYEMAPSPNEIAPIVKR
jgi:hypothetical protein